jgi:hypothetical protein
MNHTHITFRGIEDVLVNFEDHGYEPDTNAHDLEWWFEDPALNASLTEAEDAEITQHLYNIVCDPHYYQD